MMTQEEVDAAEAAEYAQKVVVERLTQQIQFARQFVRLWENGELSAEGALQQIKLDLERAGVTKL